MKYSKYKKRLARNILKNTLDTGSWIFSTIISLGEVTIDSFLNPSYYADLPSGKIEITKNFNIKKVRKNTIRQNINRLRKQGFVKKENNKYLLTLAGEKLAGYILKRKNRLEKKWDRKFRVVIFDIPEEKRKDRDWLRDELYLLNYKQLQKSVFISKYPLTTDLIKDIKRRKIGDFVNYLLVDKVYNNNG
ncbi:hypothetical protein BMS3Abin15_00293 [bacterium BMS3Abin15]|nr:hypothetical protein BMS3Abin15_00293 [bacterium BMS3Abin15]HDZ85068.1 hypothetical protein [Candidatus Moranbacteria bacterium]